MLKAALLFAAIFAAASAMREDTSFDMGWVSGDFMCFFAPVDQ